MNTPRLPAPFFVVTVMTLDPLPSILCSPTATVRLFPFPSCEALMILTPVALVIVNVADPVSFVESLWLNERVLGLIVETHCGTAVGVGVAFGFGGGVGVGLGVGVAPGFGFPFPLSPPLPFPFLSSGVGVGVGLVLDLISSPPSPPSMGGVGNVSGVGVGCRISLQHRP